MFVFSNALLYWLEMEYGVCRVNGPPFIVEEDFSNKRTEPHLSIGLRKVVV